MKVRIQGNSLRLRLSAAEVQQFAQTGRVDEAIAFGPEQAQTQHYVLARRDAVAGITVDFTGNSVMVYLPESVAAAWTSQSDTGLSGVVENGTASGLKVLIEQDQDCQH
jgi:antitoxin component of MazEF toxin-antitoxin module